MVAIIDAYYSYIGFVFQNNSACLLVGNHELL